MQVDKGKVGKDSDHCGVELLPRTTLAPEGRVVREKIQVRPFPESRIREFGFKLMDEDWGSLNEASSATDMVDKFVARSNAMLDESFPLKEIQVGPRDLPYFTEELRLLKRRRLRAYATHGGKSPQYKKLQSEFDLKLENEARKYRLKIENEVNEGKRGSSYKAIRKLG
jgi:hypothetical protein